MESDFHARNTFTLHTHTDTHTHGYTHIQTHRHRHVHTLWSDLDQARCQGKYHWTKVKNAGNGTTAWERQTTLVGPPV